MEFFYEKKDEKDGSAQVGILYKNAFFRFEINNFDYDLDKIIIMNKPYNTDYRDDYGPLDPKVREVFQKSGFNGNPIIATQKDLYPLDNPLAKTLDEIVRKIRNSENLKPEKKKNVTSYGEEINNLWEKRVLGKRC